MRLELGCPAYQSTSFLLSHRTSGSDGCGLVSRKTAKSNAMTGAKKTPAPSLRRQLPTALKGPTHRDRGRAKPTKVYDLDVEGPPRGDSAPGRGEFLARGTVLTLHLPDVTQQ